MICLCSINCGIFQRWQLYTYIRNYIFAIKLYIFIEVLSVCYSLVY